MCMKSARLPEKTEEDKQIERELEEARLVRQRQLRGELKSEKDEMTEAALARALGFVGNRSLIFGPKGGAGFMGAGSGKLIGRNKSAPSGSPASLLPAAAAPSSAPITAGLGLPFGGGSGGSTGPRRSTASLLELY